MAMTSRLSRRPDLQVQYTRHNEHVHKASPFIFECHFNFDALNTAPVSCVTGVMRAACVEWGSLIFFLISSLHKDARISSEGMYEILLCYFV